jgi:TPP-dependent pyruvate/acetoin dehydrogenase alpha subunit
MRKPIGPTSACARIPVIGWVFRALLSLDQYFDCFRGDGLEEFESAVAEKFSQGKIRSWIHLGNGNEQRLREIFKWIRPQDWVLGSWRSHYHCLLKGVPPAELMDAIVKGNSISLCFPKHRILCSGIVGGTVPIAVGIADGIKRRGGDERVYCFVGDMTAETGIFHESVKYAIGKDLPVKFIVEDNGQSVYTDTKAAWGSFKNVSYSAHFVERYKYESKKWPHSGIGRRVEF